MHAIRRIILSYVVAFFCAGAVVMPTVETVRGRLDESKALLSAPLFGLESVVRFGRVSSCGFLSGNCTEFGAWWAGLLLWPLAYLHFSVRQRRRDERELRRFMALESVSLPLLPPTQQQLRELETEARQVQRNRTTGVWVVGISFVLIVVAIALLGRTFG